MHVGTVFISEHNLFY